jgi:hypothetical protein
VDYSEVSAAHPLSDSPIQAGLEKSVDYGQSMGCCATVLDRLKEAVLRKVSIVDVELLLLPQRHGSGKRFSSLRAIPSFFSARNFDFPSQPAVPIGQFWKSVDCSLLIVRVRFIVQGRAVILDRQLQNSV